MGNQTDDAEDTFDRWKRDASVAAAAGGGAAILMALAGFAVGNVGNREARVLVEAIYPTSRFLCSAVMTASATILALMLTLIGMTVNADTDLDSSFYHRIRRIAFYDMLVLIVATTFLVLHCVPITESKELPDWWYPAVYYSVLGVAATLAGAVISIVSMLYSTVSDVIDVFGLAIANHPQVRGNSDG